MKRLIIHGTERSGRLKLVEYISNASGLEYNIIVPEELDKYINNEYKGPYLHLLLTEDKNDIAKMCIPKHSSKANYIFIIRDFFNYAASKIKNDRLCEYSFMNLTSGCKDYISKAKLIGNWLDYYRLYCLLDDKNNKVKKRMNIYKLTFNEFITRDSRKKLLSQLSDKWGYDIGTTEFCELIMPYKSIMLRSEYEYKEPIESAEDFEVFNRRYKDLEEYFSMAALFTKYELIRMYEVFGLEYIKELIDIRQKEVKVRRRVGVAKYYEDEERKISNNFDKWGEQVDINKVLRSS